jgi:hypothetical protein
MLRSIFLSVLLVGFAAGQEPPPFGTVIEQWNLPMSGSYAGAGITWVRDSGKFFLVDQGYTGCVQVWRVDPTDPTRRLVCERWQTPAIPDDSTLVAWSIAWDPDSGCYWIGAVVHTGCYLLRYVWNGDLWVWPGGPGDSWYVGGRYNGGALQLLYTAGMEKSTRDGRFYASPVAISPSPLNYVVMFDPYTKTNYGRVAHGDQTSERGCALVPWDSSYILTCGWNRSTFCKRDSTGFLLDSVHAPVSSGPADWSLHVPQAIRPDDTVCAFCINSNSTNTLQRVSLGMLWGQLGSTVGVDEKRPTAHSRPPTATVCRGSLVLPRTLEPWTLVSVAGRKVMDLQPGENDIRHLAPGVYFVRSADSGTRSAVPVRKVVIQR